MLSPKRTKFRKMQKGNNKGIAYAGSDISFGDFGLQALEPARLTSRQIEAARMAIQRHVKRAGKLWIRVFPDRPVTKKPLEVRMGGGKGAPEEWAAQVKPGRVMYEISGVDEPTAREAFRLAGFFFVTQKLVMPRRSPAQRAGRSSKLRLLLFFDLFFVALQSSLEVADPFAQALRYFRDLLATEQQSGDRQNNEQLRKAN